jgi:hypothetical protein
MDSDSRRVEFESQGVTAYEVVVNRLQRGPVVDVTGQGPSPEEAIRSTEVVLTEVNVVLSELQQAENADPNYFIRSAPVEPPSTATAMYGSTVRTAIAALTLGALCTLGLAVLAEAIARRRVARPTAKVGPDMSDVASLRTDGDEPKMSRKVGWSGILPAQWLARREPSSQEPKKTPREPSPVDPSHPELKAAGREREPSQAELSQPELTNAARREPSKAELSQPELKKAAWQESSKAEPSKVEPSKRESAWQRTFQQEPSSEFPADNGHRRPTTDWSP